MVSKIKQVISTLNNVEVHGKNNMDMLLGCIMALENICKEAQTQPKEEVKTDGR